MEGFDRTEIPLSTPSLFTSSTRNEVLNDYANNIDDKSVQVRCDMRIDIYINADISNRVDYYTILQPRVFA